jgi:hypothetical protein
MTMTPPTREETEAHWLECPCCGDTALDDPGGDGYLDGTPIECGCPGWVSVEPDGEAWVNNGDEPCPKCGP